MSLAYDFATELIEITAQTEITIQEVVDATRTAEATEQGITHDRILGASGKENLGGAVSVGVTAELLGNWQIHFESGNYIAKIGGGNLVGGPGGDPVAYSAGVQVLLIQSAASTIVQVSSGSGLSTEEHDKLLSLPTASDVRVEMDDNSMRLSQIDPYAEVAKEPTVHSLASQVAGNLYIWYPTTPMYSTGGMNRTFTVPEEDLATYTVVQPNLVGLVARIPIRESYANQKKSYFMAYVSSVTDTTFTMDRDVPDNSKNGGVYEVSIFTPQFSRMWDLTDAVNALPTSVENADTLLDRADAVESGVTVRKTLKLNASVLGGKSSGNSTSGASTPKFRNLNDTKDVVSAVTDEAGNRSAITLDLA